MAKRSRLKDLQEYKRKMAKTAKRRRIHKIRKKYGSKPTLFCPRGLEKELSFLGSWILRK